MGFDEGRIVLDSPNGAYFAGQVLNGRLEFDQDHVKTFRGIYVKVKGFCQVHWSTHHTRRVNDRTETYTVNHDSHEEYFNTKVFLVGGENGEHNLQPGHHVFPFQCPIPVNSPSSFEGSHGHIRYQVKVVVDRAFKFDQEKLVDFRVISPLDLNMNPYCKEPIQFEILNTYCCWCISSGSSQTLVKLPVAGFCPGQIMPIEISCNNTSSVEIDTIKFTLEKQIVFHATHEPGERDETDVVAQIKKGPIPPNSTRNWTVEMPIPAVDVYNLDNCRFIDISHKFEVSVETSGCHTDETEFCPVVIGSIPIVGFQDDVPNPLQDQMPAQPVISQNVPGVTSPYPQPNMQPAAPYPGAAPFPQVSPYPVGTGYPGANPPYPGANPPFPGANPPYPGGNPPPGANHYPGANSYPAAPGGSPFPPRSPYPGAISPYPNNQPGISPYPPTSSPYPAAEPYPSNPGLNPDVTTASTPLLKTGTLGFGPQPPSNNANVPSLPPGANIPYPPTQMNPYVGASAPAVSTPDNENKALIGSNANGSA